MPRRQNNRSEDSYIFHDILPAFADYGYPAAGDTSNLKIKGDIRIRMGSSYKEPDVVYYADEIPVLLVEAKKTGKSKENAEEQAKSYIRNFPIEEHSRDGRPPQYGAVTIGHKVFFYKYEVDINEHGAIIDQLEPIADIPTYDELRRLYGLEETRKPALTPQKFKDIFYQLVAALDIRNKQQITPQLVLEAVQLLYEFLKDERNYTSRSPYTKLDGHPERQRWIRNLLRQHDWSELGEEIASQFRNEILRSFQGSRQLNQYITPWTVIMLMTGLAAINSTDKVLDFECGSGGFLAAAVRSGVSLENVKGVDIADLPYLVSKLFLALNFNIRGNSIENIQVYNDNGLKFWGDDWDVVIGNPAGGKTYDPNNELNDLDQVYEHLERDLDRNGRDDPSWEYNFSIQQAVRSAKVGGRICLVLPEGFFSNSSAEFLRKYVAKHCEVKAIISLPRGVFYVGTTTRQVQAGRQGSHQKMSILFAIKTKDVVDGDGVNVDDRELNYPVFLVSVQKPSNAREISDWLEASLQRVLEEYKTWETNRELSGNNDVINFVKTGTGKKPASKQIELKVASRKKKTTSIDNKQQKPPTKEKAIIPDDLEDLF